MFVKANYAAMAAKNPGVAAPAIMPLIAAAWKQVPEEQKAAKKKEYGQQVSHRREGRDGSRHVLAWQSPTGCWELLTRLLATLYSFSSGGCMEGQAGDHGLEHRELEAGEESGRRCKGLILV